MKAKKVLLTAAGVAVVGAVLYAACEIALRQFHGANSVRFDRAVGDTLRSLGWPTGIGTVYEPHGDGEFTLQIGEDVLLVFELSPRGLHLVSCSGPGYWFSQDHVPKELREPNPTYVVFQAWRDRVKVLRTSLRGGGDSY